MRILAAVFLCLILSGCSSQKNFQAAERATDEFHMQYAKGSYGEIYDASDSAIKTSITHDQFIALLQKENAKLGMCGEAERKGFRINYTTSGKFVTMDYTRNCANGMLTENFVWHIRDSKPLLYGYHFNSPALTGS